jgi:hypothetical protein
VGEWIHLALDKERKRTGDSLAGLETTYGSFEESFAPWDINCRMRNTNATVNVGGI